MSGIETRTLSMTKVFIVLLTLLIVTAFQVMFVPESMPSCKVAVPLKQWDPPTALAGSWATWSTCNVTFTNGEHQQVLSRTSSVLRAATVLGERYLEFSNFLASCPEEISTVVNAIAALAKPLAEFRLVYASADEEVRCLEQAGDESEQLGLLPEALISARSSVTSQLLTALLSVHRAGAALGHVREMRSRETFEDFKEMESQHDFQQVEECAVSGIEKDAGADALHDLGMYFSRAALISKKETDVVKAEKFLWASEQASPAAKLTDRALARAERLYEHAELLSGKWEFDTETSASRYRNSVKVALKHKAKKMAAKYMARYAKFLDESGSLEDALKSTRDALRNDPDEPVALYMHVSLRQRLGELRTSKQIHYAEAHLSSLDGRLEAHPELEAMRVELSSHLLAWGDAEKAVSEAGAGQGLLVSMQDVWRACVRSGDAAFILLCLLCRATFAE